MYLIKEIPGAGEIDIDFLARRFLLSGAQIALVVQNACMEAICRQGNAKRLRQEDVVKYAAMEEPWGSFVSKSIGF